MSPDPPLESRFSSLNDFSRAVAGMLLAAFPEWREYARADPANLSLLLVEVPSPTSRGWPLIISTENDEITVAYDKCHDHFGWSDVPDREAFAEAKAFIDSILDEEFVLCVRMEGQDWKRSTSLTPAELSPSSLAEFTYARSWRGTYDWDNPSIHDG